MGKTKLYTMTLRRYSAATPEKMTLTRGEAYMADVIGGGSVWIRFMELSKKSGMPVFEVDSGVDVESKVFGSTMYDATGNRYRIVMVRKTVRGELEGDPRGLFDEYGNLDTKVLAERWRNNRKSVLLWTVVAWAAMYAVSGSVWWILPIAAVAAAIAVFVPPFEWHDKKNKE